MNSKLHDDRRLVLEKNNLEIIAPNLDYENDPNTFRNLIKDFNADFIIGSSAGGLFGYYLSGIKNVPALLFNPAIPFRHRIPTLPELGERKEFLQIVLGANDEIVPAMETFDYLKNNITPTAPVHIHWRNDLAHPIPIDVFESEVDFLLNKLKNNY